MLHTNKKAKELSNSAKELLVTADTALTESSCELNENLQKYFALRTSVTNKTLKDFDDTYFSIKNVDFDDAGLNIGHGELENIDHMFRNTLEPIQEVEVEEVKSGGIGATLKAFLLATLTFIVMLLVGIFSSGANVYLDKIPNTPELNTLLTWFGNFLAPGRGDPTKGAILLIGVPLLIFILVLVVNLIIKAQRNLNTAKKTLEKANEVHEKKSSQAQKSITLSEYAQTLNDTLKTLQVYMHEHNAIMQRILHVEGDDYEAYSRDSKKVVRTAVTIFKRINSIIRTNVIAKNGEISPEARQALAKCKECLEEHTKAGKTA